jgi:uncharacterized protein
MRRKDRQMQNISEIESVIIASDVCRVAFANENMPYIVTMNFGYKSGDASCFYFHCAPAGRKLEMMKKNNYVCFEMDTDHRLYPGKVACDWGMNFSSVIGYGRISIVDDEAERIEGLTCIMKQYGGNGPFSFDEKILTRTTILKLVIEEISGKKK